MRIFKGRTFSAASTKRLASALARRTPGGVCIKLEGTFGSGKTTFAAGFTGSRKVLSPSFVLKRVYRFHGNGHSAPREVHHIDLWRLPPAADAACLFDGEKISSGKAVYLVEWAERLPEGFFPPERVLRVGLRHADKPSSRDVEITAGSRALARRFSGALKVG